MNTGGPAFPVSALVYNERGLDPTTIIHDGMTLRDYFAAKAMQAHIQREDVFAAIAQDRLTTEKVCSGCYAWADKMLEARKQ